MSTNNPNNPNNPYAAQSGYGASYGARYDMGPGGSAGVPAAAPQGAGTEALVFDVTEADFEREVLQRSMQVPVLLDCWAPWCGPCRSLGPMLEKVVDSYGGAVVLAKINTDEAPNLSAALRIRSIPLVVLFIGGRPVDQFVGALPEGKIREFLERHVQAQPGVPPVQALREAAAAATDPAEAEALLLEALDHEPGHPEVLMDLAEGLSARGALDDAQALLERVAEADRGDRHGALLKRLAILRNRPPGNAEELAARITTNPRDFEARFALAALFMFDQRYQAAFDQLLEVVLRDKGEWREKARTQLVEWFSACPDADAVSHGRRYLGMYLN